jgi:hypothetical protein
LIKNKIINLLIGINNSRNTLSRISKKCEVKKMSEMNKIEQFLKHNMTWKRQIKIFNQENSLLKNRLSEAVDMVIDKKYISNAEYFQNQFIIIDEIINDMGRDIKLNEKKLQSIIDETKKSELNDFKMQEKLGNEMIYLEKEFLKLKKEFTEYINTIEL